MAPALPAYAVSLAGLVLGFACGFFVWRARLCSFGAIEDALIGRDWRRMKIFALALGLAILATQALVLGGALDPGLTTYAPPRVAWASALAGSLMFGFGMAMVGTCAFGSLVRLGGGDLRSLVVLMAFGAVAYAALRGVLAPLRIGVVESVFVETPGPSPSALPSILNQLGFGQAGMVAAALIGLALVGWPLVDRRLLKARRLLTAGLVLGFAVALGWIVTGVLVDEFAGPVRPQSLTFVAPVGRALFGLLAGEGSLGDLGVASVVGVALGAWFAALRASEFRWEAFDDHREMRRHLGGAALMGLGGVLAGGCTIGQGLTAGSLLAVTWPITVAGMIVGARLGIAVLMEGGLRGLFGRG
jgi:uncharacterized membrane protein YedE/YeeE